MKEDLLRVLKKRAPEIGAIALACIGCLILAVSIVTSAGQQELVIEDGSIQKDAKDAAAPTISPMITTTAPNQNRIYVDISGAVNSPGVYSLTPTARLSDAIEMAGGLSRKADADYFSRNYNIARLLTDQEKIYIPRTDEVVDGTFVEGVYYIDHSLKRIGVSPDENKEGAAPATGSAPSSGTSSGININTASTAELETLSGIGPVTAQKIIDNRPYADVNDLLTNKIMKESVFNDISDKITVGGVQ